MNPYAENFEETLDVRSEDFEDCRDIAEELEDPVGSFFICRELDIIDARQDNGYASFWLYQAKDMVEAVRSVISAHTFISRAFDICFGYNAEGSLPDRARAFFMEYPDLTEHTFTEVFAFCPQKNGGLDYKHILRLARELGADFDRYYSSLHEKRNSLSIVKGYRCARTRNYCFSLFWSCFAGIRGFSAADAAAIILSPGQRKRPCTATGS